MFHGAIQKIIAERFMEHGVEVILFMYSSLASRKTKNI